MEGQATGEPSENRRSRSPEQGIGRAESEQADKRVAQASAEVTNAADVAIGGGRSRRFLGMPESMQSWPELVEMTQNRTAPKL
jgi:hypothetical protein